MTSNANFRKPPSRRKFNMINGWLCIINIWSFDDFLPVTHDFNANRFKQAVILYQFKSLVVTLVTGFDHTTPAQIIGCPLLNH